MKLTFEKVGDLLEVGDLALTLGQSRTGCYFREHPWPLLRTCGSIYIK